MLASLLQPHAAPFGRRVVTNLMNYIKRMRPTCELEFPHMIQIIAALHRLLSKKVVEFYAYIF